MDIYQLWITMDITYKLESLELESVVLQSTRFPNVKSSMFIASFGDDKYHSSH